MSLGGSTNARININQIDPRYQSQLTTTSTLVPNPFFGVAAAGTLSTRQTIEIGQLLRPFPEFGNVYMQQSTGARSQYHAAILQVRKRTTGLWGGTFSYTYSRLNDNQFGESNYYSSNPGVQNFYTVIPGSAYYNPDAEYGRSLLDSPHKLVIAPILNLPFGRGQKFLSTSALGDALLGGWTVTTVVTLQSGFPIGVTQNLSSQSFLYGSQTNARPNVVPGQDFLVGGDITSRIEANVSDNLLYNKSAFANAAANQFGDAPRMLPGVLSPWRNNIDLGVSKQIHTGAGTSASVRVEVLNLFNIVQWAAPASSSFGNSSFGQINNQANNMRMVQFTARFQF
jgi:trimeric autotransporter adhesin